jgi:cytidylate kinase
MNNIYIEQQINTLEVSEMVSEIAAIPEIRREMVKLQRNIDRNMGVVMDGRDIGSVVFPDADIKLFLTASDSVRAKRRFDEMILKGESVKYESILNNIKNRDKLDSSRLDSPLVIEKDAFLIDNSNMTINDQLEIISNIIDKKLLN